jgi:hypothetical protein
LFTAEIYSKLLFGNGIDAAAIERGLNLKAPSLNKPQLDYQLNIKRKEITSLLHHWMKGNVWNKTARNHLADAVRDFAPGVGQWISDGIEEVLAIALKTLPGNSKMSSQISTDSAYSSKGLDENMEESIDTKILNVGIFPKHGCVEAANSIASSMMKQYIKDDFLVHPFVFTEGLMIPHDTFLSDIPLHVSCVVFSSTFVSNSILEGLKNHCNKTDFPEACFSVISAFILKESQLHSLYASDVFSPTLQKAFKQLPKSTQIATFCIDQFNGNILEDALAVQQAFQTSTFPFKLSTKEARAWNGMFNLTQPSFTVTSFKKITGLSEKESMAYVLKLTKSGQLKKFCSYPSKLEDIYTHRLDVLVNLSAILQKLPVQSSSRESVLHQFCKHNGYEFQDLIGLMSAGVFPYDLVLKELKSELKVLVPSVRNAKFAVRILDLFVQVGLVVQIPKPNIKFRYTTDRRWLQVIVGSGMLLSPKGNVSSKLPSLGSDDCVSFVYRFEKPMIKNILKSEHNFTALFSLLSNEVYHSCSENTLQRFPKVTLGSTGDIKVLIARVDMHSSHLIFLSVFGPKLGIKKIWNKLLGFHESLECIVSSFWSHLEVSGALVCPKSFWEAGQEKYCQIVDQYGLAPSIEIDQMHQVSVHSSIDECLSGQGQNFCKQCKIVVPFNLMHPPVDPCSLANETSKANFHVSNLDVPMTFALTKDQIQSQASFQHDSGYFEHTSQALLLPADDGNVIEQLNEVVDLFVTISNCGEYRSTESVSNDSSYDSLPILPWKKKLAAFRSNAKRRSMTIQNLRSKLRKVQKRFCKVQKRFLKKIQNNPLCQRLAISKSVCRRRHTSRRSGKAIYPPGSPVHG